MLWLTRFIELSDTTARLFNDLIIHLVMCLVSTSHVMVKLGYMDAPVSDPQLILASLNTMFY